MCSCGVLLFFKHSYGLSQISSKMTSFDVFISYCPAYMLQMLHFFGVNARLSCADRGNGLMCY